jgi:hypothetical protein
MNEEMRKALEADGEKLRQLTYVMNNKRKISAEGVRSSQGMATLVKRWHTWPMLLPDTVGRHSCRAALIYMEIWGLPRAEVLAWLLMHDLGELTAGDTPSSAKDFYPLEQAVSMAEMMGRATCGVKLPELLDDEANKCELADRLEAWETALIEHSMGNSYAECVIEDLSVHIHDILDETATKEEAALVYGFMKSTIKRI